MEEVTLSKRLTDTVKPLEEGETRVFKLIGAGKFDPVSKRAFFPTHTTCGVFNIYDKFEKDKARAKKVIKNIVGTETVLNEQGQYVQKEIIEDIDFNRQSVTIVRHTEHQKLICLSLCNENASNPFRDKKVKPLFEEVKDKEELQRLSEELDYDHLAGTIVREAIAGKGNEFKQLAISLGVYSDMKSSVQIIHDLKLKAKTHPKEVLRAGADWKVKMNIYATDAIDAGIIILFPDTREWRYIEADILVCDVKPGEVEFDRLIEYLVSNQAAKKHLIEVVNRAVYKIAA
jgi:hypothetical protein